METFAPVTTAPEESTTLPARLPRTDDSDDPWANAGTVNAVSSARTATAATIFLVIFDSFQSVSLALSCQGDEDSGGAISRMTATCDIRLLVCDEQSAC